MWGRVWTSFCALSLLLCMALLVTRVWRREAGWRFLKTWKSESPDFRVTGRGLFIASSERRLIVGLVDTTFEAPANPARADPETFVKDTAAAEKEAEREVDIQRKKMLLAQAQRDRNIADAVRLELQHYREMRTRWVDDTLRSRASFAESAAIDDAKSLSANQRRLLCGIISANGLESPSFAIHSAWTSLGVPLWMLTSLSALAPSFWAAQRVTRMRRRLLRSRAGQCLACGYDLRASVGRCPECGRAFEQAKAQAAEEPASPLAPSPPHHPT